jgi:hypothetical protein
LLPLGLRIALAFICFVKTSYLFLKGTKMKLLFLLSVILNTLFVILNQSTALAYPAIDQPVSTGGLPVAVYRDFSRSDIYWYLPTSIEPWTRDSRYRSSLYDQDGVLSFIFRGQASVDERTLGELATFLHVPPSGLIAVPYEDSKNFVCQNIFIESDHVSWTFPKMIGNFQEVLPISIRTKNPKIIGELRSHLKSGGLACTVEVSFKAISSAYRLEVHANLNRIYDGFRAAGHVSGFWWSADLSAALEKLKEDHAIEISSLEDSSLTPSELDTQIKAAMDDLLKTITTALFTPALKLPEGDVNGRGSAWRLRGDYRHTTENQDMRLFLDANKTQFRNTQISVRLAID